MPCTINTLAGSRRPSGMKHHTLQVAVQRQGSSKHSSVLATCVILNARAVQFRWLISYTPPGHDHATGMHCVNSGCQAITMLWHQSTCPPNTPEAPTRQTERYINTFGPTASPPRHCVRECSSRFASPAQPPTYLWPLVKVMPRSTAAGSSSTE